MYLTRTALIFDVKNDKKKNCSKDNSNSLINMTTEKDMERKTQWMSLRCYG